MARPVQEGGDSWICPPPETTMPEPHKKAASLRSALAGMVKCWAGKHALEEIRPLARDTVLAECTRCGRRWAVKGIGGQQDVLIPWSPAAEEVYDRLATRRAGTGDRVRTEISKEQRVTNVFTED